MEEIKVGNIVKGKITGITSFGLFVDLGEGYLGLVHISEVTSTYINDLKDKYSINDIISMKVLEIDKETRRTRLSIKRIDLRERKDVSTLLEKSRGFKPLEDNLDRWITKKVKELERKEQK
ncbi:MAG: S1 RNA-binding domain-containing protein [Bacilli bacterium]